MAKRRRKHRGEAHTSSPASLRRVQANDLTNGEEQLMAEVEELQRQVSEFQEGKDQDKRAIQGWEWLARLSDENPDPIMRVSQHGVIQYRNPASVSLCRLWNPADEGMLPPTVYEIVKAAYASTEIIRQEMAFGERAYLVTVAPPPPPEKYINIFARDITLRKQAEKRLQELNATLEDKVAERTAELEYRARQLQKMTLELSETEERERKRMAEILHDDLQQILAAAKFHLSLMRNRVKHDASLQTIGLEIDAMLKEAIEKSRSLSHELSPAVLHHGDFHEALNWLANQIKAKHGLVVHVHAHGNVNLQSDTITTLLYRTVQELLFNVVKHARTAEATIQARRHGRWVGLAVSDRGCGFDPQELRGAAGYGLLSIRERIELLGGRMKIESTKGKGSTVLVIVPDRQSLGAPSEIETMRNSQTAEARLSPHGNTSRLRVLLADDHKIVREGLRLLLTDQPDVEIVGEAAHGREAVDMALRLEPDVVIMDVAMPLIDGDAATHQIKEQLPQTRVIALSTFNEPEKMERMFRAGADGYVLKTASSDELLTALRGKKAEIAERLAVQT